MNINYVEVSVLSEAFNDPSFALVAGIVPEDFSETLHARLWALMQDAARRGSRVTMETLAQAWPIEHVEYCRKVFEFGGAIADVKSDLVALKEQSARRKIAAVAEQIKIHANDAELPPDELVVWAMRELMTRATSPSSESNQAVAESVANGLTRPTVRFSTGMKRLDFILGGGLFAGKMYGVAARKKVGKTAFLGTVSHNLNEIGVTHLFVALEMSPVEIQQRNMARALGINSIAFLTREMPDLIERAADYAANVKNFTWYEHSPGVSFDELRSMISRAIVHHKITGVILDYWQLVGGREKGENEEYHLRCVAQWLADICRRENIWALVAAQVNQEGNTRGGEGLKLACDCYFTLHREKHEPQAWLEMEESRYTMYQNIGSDLTPGLWFQKNGPYFECIDERLSDSEFGNAH